MKLFVSDIEIVRIDHIACEIDLIFSSRSLMICDIDIKKYLLLFGILIFLFLILINIEIVGCVIETYDLVVS